MLPSRASMRSMARRCGTTARFCAAVAVFVMGVLPARFAGASCNGDCNANGVVQPQDLLQALQVALGMLSSNACAALRVGQDGRVTVDALLSAVDDAAAPCVPNQPPVVAAAPVYRTYPGQAINTVIEATDADHDQLRYAASDLPAGALLDPQTGTLTWTPGPAQVGPFHIDFIVTDDGLPPLSAAGARALEIMPPDTCVQPDCDPSSGCTSTLLPLTQPCCIELPSVRVPEPAVGCPAGRILFVGRNMNGGVGRLQDCDRLQVINFGQTTAQVRLNFEARCLNVAELVTVHVRMESTIPTKTVLFDLAKPLQLVTDPDGYARHLTVQFPLTVKGPFFSLEGAETILKADVTDVDGNVVTENLRLTMTFSTVDDLPDLPDE